jgi:hypothetical protein
VQFHNKTHRSIKDSARTRKKINGNKSAKHWHQVIRDKRPIQIQSVFFYLFNSNSCGTLLLKIIFLPVEIAISAKDGIKSKIVAQIPIRRFPKWEIKHINYFTVKIGAAVLKTM